MTEVDDLDRMPLAEADAYMRAQMDHHRAQMSHWRLARGNRILRELQAGMKPAEIAVEIGASTTVVHALAAEARRGYVALGPSPEAWWEGLTAGERAAFLAVAKRPADLPRGLAEKMRAAGVVVAEVGFSELHPVLPRPYVDFLRAMADEAAGGDGRTQ